MYKVVLLVIFFSCGQDLGNSLSDASANSIRSINRADGDLSNGALRYSQHCASCHNSDGSGTSSGPNIQSKSDAQILNAVLNGKGAMPAITSLSVDEIEDIAAVFDTF